MIVNINPNRTTHVHQEYAPIDDEELNSVDEGG